MKNTIGHNTQKMLCVILMIASLSACLGDNNKKGACVPRANPLGCADNYTKEKCDMLNGRFYEGKSCSDLGYTSS